MKISPIAQFPAHYLFVASGLAVNENFANAFAKAIPVLMSDRSMNGA